MNLLKLHIDIYVHVYMIVTWYMQGVVSRTSNEYQNLKMLKSLM
jgi:hypothetical protein